MKRLMTLALALTFTFGIAGCKKSEEAIMEDAVKLQEKLADVIDANKADCDKMAKEIKSVVEKNKKLIEQAKALKGKVKDNKELMTKYGPRMKAAAMKMMGGAMKCMTNKAVGEAFKSMK